MTKDPEPDAPPERTPSEKLEAVFAAYNRSDQPGFVVAVARRGKLLYRKGFGLASIEHAVANTPATRLRIGSTSKHFTCLAALLLAEEGKLDLDAPVTDILPELPPLHGAPTLRQFMSHTSGYRCYLDLAILSTGMAIQPAGRALTAQTRQSDVNFDPVDGQLYCNGGYHLLSVAIERVSGMTFESFLKARIFDPLGMADTLSAPSDMDIIPGIATMHTPNPKGGWRRGVFITEEVRGEGAIVSTVDDMLRWLAHMNGPKIVGSDETWAQMTAPAVLKDGYQTVYALGLFNHPYRGIQVIHHGGGVIGGTCAMLTAPAHGLDIIIVANGGPANVGKLQFEIIDALLGDALTEAAPVMADADRFKHLDGARYRNARGVMFGFGLVEGKLGVSMFGAPAAPILRDEGETLRIGFEDAAVGPFVWPVSQLEAGPDGEAPATIEVSETGRATTFRRLPAQAPAMPPVAASLVGRYRSQDLGCDGEISLDGDKLQLVVRSDYGMTHFGLEVLASDFVKADLTEMPGFGAGVTLLPDGAFHLTSGRSRQVRFERLSA